MILIDDPLGLYIGPSGDGTDQQQPQPQKMDQATKEKMMAKVKALMAKADQNANDSSAEAAAAMAKARELMNKYGLSQDDLIMENINEAMATCRGKFKTTPEYMDSLAALVADLFQCFVYWRKVQVGYKKWRSAPVFVGYKPHEEIAAYTFDVLYRMLSKARAKYRPEGGRPGRSWAKYYKDSYATAWVQAVRDSVLHLIPPVREKRVMGETGLVPVDPLQHWVEEKINLTKSYTRGLRSLDPASARAGIADGSKVRIGKAVNDGRPGGTKLIG